MTETAKGKHTPGPWNIASGLRVMGTDGAMREVPAFYIEQAGRLPGENCVCGLVPRKHDARLIAAAPDLLAALSDLMIVAEEAGCDTLAQIRAAAAIAKAEGGAA